ncbi:PQQ-dependent sugar dehydrogenase [Natrinema limicola]|uniref:Blue (Type 1) copper domain-containing protein n=1 Tax=Natrinema limicola JCM 13563 TaxID=1230457 RepID=M0CGC4_9EURY|nr:PQQ-dependent sugar dehydrogenase [Natrinema limicola]ELZ20924.1 blue (type 1) copper domain-containing protein [Natrinema limicola JCM 13563]
MTRNDDSTPAVSRRTVLRSSAALSAAGLALPVLGQQDAITGEIRLGGQISGWVGQEPEPIADERNPTLRLVEGRDYTLIWENVDGAGHNFVIENEAGDEEFVSTDILAMEGETQTVEFTAQEGMAAYYCQPHTSTMRGEIELVGEEGNGDMAAAPDQVIGQGPTVGIETVAEGLTAPTSLTVADEDADRRFITDQTGQIYVHGPDGLEDEPFLDISDQLVEFMEFDERGLLGLAFHPEFADNGQFYVRYSSPPRDGTPEEYDHTFVLSEFQTASDDNATADPDSERVILEIPEPQFNHNSGNICFGPDGYLYVGTGDGGGANDTGTGHVDDWYDENDGGNGQDTQENLLGAILRIDVDQEGETTPYAIPDDNPLVDQEGELGEHYAWGFRNPWGMSFTDGGELLAADVGQNLFESVNHVQRGGNYSWNVKEGTHCFSTEMPSEPPQNCPQRTPEDVRGGEPLLDPVIEYPHEVSVLEPELGAENGGGNETDAGNETTSGTETAAGNETASGTGVGGEGVSGGQIGVSVTGGSLYEGGEISDLEGTYVFGDWSIDGQNPGTVFLARPPEGWQDASGDRGETEPGPSTDDAEGNETVDNETAIGNETDSNGTGTAAEGEATQESGQDGLWPIEQIQLEGEAAENGRPTGFVYAFGEGADGEIYVLTTSTSTVEGEGAVHRLVPADGDGGEEPAELRRQPQSV